MKRVITIVVAALVVLAGALACVLFMLPNKETQGPAQEYWPQGEWRTSAPEAQGMDSAVLADMITSIKQSGMNVNSVTIIRNGYLVSEAYFYPYEKGCKHALNSCTKSFLSAVVGDAVEDGSISIGDSVLDYFSGIDIANVDESKKDMTIRNLLGMTTGFDWKMGGSSDSTNEMLQSGDWAKYTLDLPMKQAPGAGFNYCNGAANIMSSIVQQAAGKSAEQLFMEKFAALGITDYCWGKSPEDTSIGYSGTFMIPDDAAKFGYLYLKNGRWNGEQLIPEAWVEASTKLQAAADWNALFPGYGYMWWITKFGGCDGYAAMGYGGDYIFVVPDKELVVVFTGGMFNDVDLFYPGTLMDKYIVPSVKSGSPIQGDGEALKQAVDMVQNAPAPIPVPLPDVALRISDKTYSLGDMGTLVLHFNKGGGEFTFDISSGTFTAGLDGVYRVSDIGSNGTLPDHNLVAVTGIWLGDDTLQVEIRSLVDGYITTYTIHFSGDNIDVTAKSNIGQDQSFSGALE